MYIERKGEENIPTVVYTFRMRASVDLLLKLSKAAHFELTGQGDILCKFQLEKHMSRVVYIEKGEKQIGFVQCSIIV